MIKAVIFDMDGVLIDSVRAGVKVRTELLARKYGIDLSSVPDPHGEGHRAASMKTLLTSVENHTGTRIDPDEFATLSQAHMKQTLLENGAGADPALMDLLKELEQHGIARAIASSSVRQAIDNKLDILGIRHYFSVIVTGTDAKEHKPHPETYLLATDKLNLSPAECVVIEDSVTGVQAGVAAGCRVVGLTQYNPVKAPLPGVAVTVNHWQDITYDMLLHLDANQP